MQQRNKKRRGYLISALLLLTLVLITLFAIFLFMHPDVYFSKASGFSQHDGVRAGKNKLRFVVPETVDTTKSTYISVKQEWFETSRMGKDWLRFPILMARKELSLTSLKKELCLKSMFTKKKDMLTLAGIKTVL